MSRSVYRDSSWRCPAQRVADLDLRHVAAPAERRLHAVGRRQQHEKSSIRSSRPSIFWPFGCVTTTVTCRRFGGAPGAPDHRGRGRRHRPRPPRDSEAARDRRPGWRVPADRPSANGTSSSSPGSTPAPAAASPTRMFGRLLGARRRRALSAHRRLHGVDVRGDGLDVVGRERQRRHDRHARILTAAGDDRTDELAVQIVQRELRAQQVRAADVAAAQIDAVTGTAVNAVEGRCRGR